MNRNVNFRHREHIHQIRLFFASSVRLDRVHCAAQSKNDIILNLTLTLMMNPSQPFDVLDDVDSPQSIHDAAIRSCHAENLDDIIDNGTDPKAIDNELILSGENGNGSGCVSHTPFSARAHIRRLRFCWCRMALPPPLPPATAWQ